LGRGGTRGESGKQVLLSYYAGGGKGREKERRRDRARGPYSVNTLRKRVVLIPREALYYREREGLV